MSQVSLLLKPCQGEIEVKKSRFIADIVPVSSEEEALAHIAAMKKQYWDARHNCPAFIIESVPLLERCSDDGEPQGTAGKPILSVLTGARLVNVCAVVTRYFGGTLLGTGGLVKAYTEAAAAALANGEVAERVDGTAFLVDSDYTDLGKIQYLLAKAGAITQDTEYADRVRLSFVLPTDEAKQLKNAITEGTAGRALFARQEQVRYVTDSKGVVTLL